MNFFSALMILGTAACGYHGGADYNDGKNEQATPTRALAVTLDTPDEHGLWVTVYNNLPVKRDEHGQIISQMFINTHLRADVRRDLSDRKHAQGVDDYLIEEPGSHSVELYKSVLAQRQETFYLTGEQVAALREVDNGRVTLGIVDSVQVDDFPTYCQQSVRLLPQSTLKQALSVEVRQRQYTGYGCNLSIQAR